MNLLTGASLLALSKSTYYRKCEHWLVAGSSHWAAGFEALPLTNHWNSKETLPQGGTVKSHFNVTFISLSLMYVTLGTET